VALLARALGLDGSARATFEALVDQRRRGRPVAASGREPTAETVAPAAEVAPRPAHNLPRALSSFVGREQELAELASVLATTPLLSLVGAGGVGKTRLAQELVRDQTSTYADGSWLVELAGLADPSLVPGAVAAAVGLRDFHVRTTRAVLEEYLSDKHLLLVLDNCEHLVGACAELVADLLRRCPHVRVLATSREPLAIPGEVIWQVLPLGLPDLSQLASAERVARSPAVRLFVERAQAASPSFALSPDNAATIARICVGVDGIPLAIELAAARTRLLGLDELAERLAGNYYDARVLGGTHRAGLPQHRTIRATIDWSHDLLDEAEQILLRRLSVFAGGWTLELAELVCAGDGLERAAVFDLLAQLVDKSMVLVDVGRSLARYRLLEPIRQYAAERLVAAGEATTYGARHAAAVLELAQSDRRGLAGPDEISSLDRLAAEHDNLRVALRWALDHDDGGAALRAAAALFRYWERRGHFEEGRGWLEQALASAHDTPARWRVGALNALAFLYWRGGDAARAESIAEQALLVSRRSGQPREVAQALLNLGMTAYLQHAHDLAVEHLEESVAYARQADRLPLLSLALTFLGRARLWLHGPFDPGAARAVEESLQLAEATQSRYVMGHALATLGDLAWAQGAAEAAVERWRQALEVAAELADGRAIAGCLERLGLVLAVCQQLELAAWVFGAAEAEHCRLGFAWRQDDEEVDHGHFVIVVREQMGAALQTAWSAGQAAPLAEAIDRTLAATDCVFGLDLAAARAGDTYELAAGITIPRPRLTRIETERGQRH